MANTRACPDCGGLVSTRAKLCPHCGRPATAVRLSEVGSQISGCGCVLILAGLIGLTMLILAGF